MTHRTNATHNCCPQTVVTTAGHMHATIGVQCNPSSAGQHMKCATHMHMCTLRTILKHYVRMQSKQLCAHGWDERKQHDMLVCRTTLKHVVRMLSKQLFGAHDRWDGETQEETSVFHTTLKHVVRVVKKLMCAHDWDE